MAVRWLNAARYADTNGYQTDGERIMWRWRDWVIDAYNRNMPFDQFTIEQLAGDLLPAPTLDQRIATGFNRNHRGNGEGGIIPEEYAVEYVVDRVETTATVWLGLTLACARCHDHKFDPITQEEFYQFFAYFNNVPENGRAIKIGNSPPMIKTPTPPSRTSSTRSEARLEDLERQARRARARNRVGPGGLGVVAARVPALRLVVRRPSGRSLQLGSILWARIKRGDWSNRISATASPITSRSGRIGHRARRPCVPRRRRRRRVRLLRQVHARRLDQADGRVGAPSSRGWSTSRKPKATAPCSTRQDARQPGQALARRRDPRRDGSGRPR